jgi:cell division protein FtsW
MNKDSKAHNESANGRFWNFIDNIEGDKVVWVIVFMLIIFSILAIFSSTSLLQEGSKDRMDFIKDHILIVGFGLGIISVLYNIKRIGVFRVLSQLGFALSFLFLLILDLHVKIPGVVEAEYINGAWRTLRVAGFQVHVFEVVKVAMVLYLAWALHAFKEDQEALKKRHKSKYMKLCNSCTGGKLDFLSRPFGKRAIYMYIPILTVCVLTLMGSGSSAVFIGVILIATLLIGGMPFKEIALA